MLLEPMYHEAFGAYCLNTKHPNIWCSNASGAAMAGTLGPLMLRARPVASEASIKYLKLAKGVIATAKVEGDPQTIADTLERDGKIRFNVLVDLVDELNEVVSQLNVEWHVKMKQYGWAMTGSRTNFHHGDLAQAALQAARGFVEIHGSDNLTWRGLADLLGVNHRALYRHFADREDVVIRIAQEGFRELSIACTQAMESVQSPQNFKAMMLAFVEFSFAQPKLYDLMFSLPLKDEIKIDNPLSQHLRELNDVSIRASKKPDESRTASRNRVIRVLGQAHGLISFFRSGVFNSKSDAASIKYITELVQQSIDF